MNTVRFQDVGEVAGQRVTPEGFLIVTADFAKPGVQEYYAGELKRESLPEQFRDDPMRIIKALRPETEVFDKASMDSFGHKPLTDDHPPEFINSTNYRNYQIGLTRGDVSQHENRLRVGLTVQDAKAIASIQDGKTAVSAGYDTVPVWGPGTDPVHGAYDVKQTQIRGNHIAVVDKARGGPEVRINDSWPKATPTNGDSMDPVKKEINGITVEFSDQGAQAVDHLVTQRTRAEGERDALAVKLSDAQKALDKAKGELDVQKAAELTDQQIEDRVVERLDVIDRAKRLHDKIDPRGKSLNEIRVETIKHVDTDKFDLDGKSEDYVNAVFDTLAASTPKKTGQSLTDALKDAGQKIVDDDIAGKARAKHDEWTKNAWKGEVIQ